MTATRMVDVAREYVLSLLEGGLGRAGRRLPPLQEMAFGAGVSLVTMQKAVTALRREGLVHTVPGKGVYAGDGSERTIPSGPLHTTRPLSLASERIRARIEADIVSGRYDSGPLPGISELAGCYGGCYRTVRKALRTLTHEGRLTVQKRRYVPVRLSSPRGTGAVVLVCRRPRGEHTAAPVPMQIHGVRFFEEECLHRNLVLRVAGYRYVGPRLQCDRTSEKALRSINDPSVLGTIIMSHGLRELDFDALIQRVGSAGKPIAVYDPDTLVPDHPVVIRFSTASTFEAGLQMGRYALEIGHRMVAYIAPHHYMAWSRQRLDGFRKAFADAGVPHGVVGLVDSSDRAVVPVEQLQQVREEVLRAGVSRENPLHVTFARAVNTLVAPIGKAVDAQQLADRTVPLIEQAVSLSGCTGIAAENDAVAAACLPWMRRHGLAVPRDYSLLSFDDSYQAFSLGLTSYHFSVRSVYSALLNILLEPRGRRGDRPGEYRFPGKVMVRGSSRPVSLT